MWEGGIKDVTCIRATMYAGPIMAEYDAFKPNLKSCNRPEAATPATRENVKSESIE